MKKSGLVLIFVLAFAFFSVPVRLYSQETVVETDTPIGGVEMIATESSVIGPQRINYELPYPGILPDNPFYFLKMIRDNMVKMLINDHLTRAKFSLENAEKRVFAGKLLIDKGKDELALETISKGVNYLNDTLKAVEKVRRENPKDPHITPFKQQFKTSTQKLQELLKELQGPIDPKYRKPLLEQEERVSSLEKSVLHLLEQK